jgi:hypothetical protein
MAFYAQKDPRIRSRLDASSEAAKVEEKPKAILEDYMLDDELSKSSTSKGPKTPPMPAAGNSWQSVPPTVPGADIKTTPQQVKKLKAQTSLSRKQNISPPTSQRAQVQKLLMPI